MTTVGVLGAVGRMGVAVCEALDADPDLTLAVRVDPAGGDGVETDRSAITQADVAVDFTRPDQVLDNVRFCVDAGVHVVVGTTGLSADDLDAIRGWCDAGSANVFVAPNFSIGAVLAMRFGAEAARHFPSAEVIELHHNRKLDAPSGTALAAARRIAEAWATHGRPPDGEAHPDEREVVQGARGADVDGVHVHAVRSAGSLAHLEVVLGGPGESLTIRHDSLDRASFMPGVLLAVKAVPNRTGLTVGLEHLLD